MKRYDIIVIGAGGGTKIVSPAAKLGYKVAVIEKGALGGTCLNRGCIPSKMLIHAADVASGLEEAPRFDIKIADPDFAVDFERLVTRVSDTIDGESRSIGPLYEKNPNIDLYPHEGRFVADKVVRVNGEDLTAEKIFIAAGSRPMIPDVEGLADTPYWTSEEALRTTRQPKRLIVIGGGYIACELGHFFGSLGTEVEILARSVLLRREDADVVDEFGRAFAARHSVHLHTLPTRVAHADGIFTVQCKPRDGDAFELSADALLVVTGVRPNSDWLGLENTGIRVDERGYIPVDEHLRTAVDGVWALGDILGRYLFRHTVNFEGEYLMRTVVADSIDEPIDYGPVPSAVFTMPQVASVGATEAALKRDGVDYVVGLNRYENSAMGMALLPDYGFVKILVERETRKLLGAHVIGVEAATMIHMLIAFMSMGGTLDDLLGMIYIHPALPEVVRNAARKAREALG